MNRNELTLRHWKYYLMLENHFIKSLEFVELHIDNFNTFSNGYAQLIQSIGAELDSVFKEYCQFDTGSRKTIDNYARYILSHTPNIINQKILILGYDIEIQPFQNWDATKPSGSLKWWTAFTDVKHNRYDKLKQANLENVLNILGALYLVEMVYLKEITKNTSAFDVFDESSKIFTLENWSSKATPLSDCWAVHVSSTNDLKRLRGEKKDE